MTEPVRRIVILGGGTAGWMTAAMMAKVLPHGYSIRLVESDEISIIGVGEATIPSIKAYNAALELNEDEFLRRTQGTFKMGIEFRNWGRSGDRYIHGFGRIGQDWGILRCHQYWLRQRQLGPACDFGALSINTVAPLSGRFMRSQPRLKDSPLADIAYAFHFDARLYAAFLREYAEARGVRRTEGKVVDVALDEVGNIASLLLYSGERIDGQLFIDCSGLRARLLGEAMGVGYEDWSHWLPCDRAVAVPCGSVEPLLPMTRATAWEAGWQWRIPLQHRIGNGHVYSSRFTSDEVALERLMANLDGAPLADPRPLRFTPGKRRTMWKGNCIAIGLASGFLEPLESTSIHLIQSAVIRLMRFFPLHGFNEIETREYNRRADFEIERVRDFIILHYKATERDDSPMWNYCRTMSIPASLQEKIALFREHGRVFRDNEELFAEESWIQVFIGQHLLPRSYDPVVDQKSPPDIAKYLADIETTIRKCVQVMPTHRDFIGRHCRAASP